jgi:hypothetical protein
MITALSSRFPTRRLDPQIYSELTKIIVAKAHNTSGREEENFTPPLPPPLLEPEERNDELILLLTVAQNFNPKA